MLRTSGTLHEKADRTDISPGFAPSDAATRLLNAADPPGQIIELRVDLLLALDDFLFLGGVPIAPF